MRPRPKEMWHQDQAHYHHGDGPRQIRPRPQQPQQQPPHRHINPPPLMSINPIPPVSTASASTDCWEDLFDSGQLDLQLQQRLNIGAAGGGAGPQFHKPPPPQQQRFPPQPGYHYPPPPPPGPPTAPSPQGNPMFSCPPPPINHHQSYQSGIRNQVRPLHPQQQPPPPPPNQPPQQQQQRMKILTRPAPPRQPQPQPQLQEQPRNFRPVPLAPPPAPESAPARPQVQIQIAQSDNSLNTQYRPPDPVIKIMKRPTAPAGGDSTLENGGENAKRKPKTLKQREEEYAQARLRILGSAGTPEPPPSEEDEQDAVAAAAAANSVKVLSDGSAQPVAKHQPAQSGNNIERTPNGPDGSKGFQFRKK